METIFGNRSYGISIGGSLENSKVAARKTDLPMTSVPVPSMSWNGVGFEVLQKVQFCRTIGDRIGIGAHNYTTGFQNSTVHGGVGKIKNIQYYAITVAFGLLAIAVAKGFVKLRRTIFKEYGNIDRAFDAGRKVSYGLIASLLVSNWTWAATLLQSSTVAAKYGISGAFWYAAGASVQLLLFSILAIQLKIVGPGAKTFLQIIRIRFGAKCHILYCSFALLTNIIVTAMLMLGGYESTKYIIEDLNILRFTLLMIVVIGSYTFIGGMGATLYVSYFNTSFIFIIMIYICHSLYSDKTKIGGIKSIYENLYCSRGPERNLEESYVTFVSFPGLQFGIINLIGNFGAVFVDQSYWNCAMASKPKDSIIGFILGGLIWFAIPFTLATSGGLTFRALEFMYDKPLLTSLEIDKGLVLPKVATILLGTKGGILIYILLLMAISSTASSNIVAVVSIVTYDIFQIYIWPFRRSTDINSCILCGKQRGRKANLKDKCVCVSLTYCKGCKSDDKELESNKYNISPSYKCKVHGHFRTYYSEMENKKSWIMLWITISILPLTLFLSATTIQLNWLYQFMGILIGSVIIPICLSLYWGQLTPTAMFLGASVGCAFGLVAWIGATFNYAGSGSGKFLINSGREFPMVLGNMFAILSGGLITSIWTLFSRPKKSVQEIAEIWENTRDIDNPLSPWVEVYENDFNLTDAHHLDDRPSLVDVKNKFKLHRLYAATISITLFVIIIIAWPIIASSLKIFSLEEFTTWIYVSLVWSWIAAIFILLVPLAQEVIAVVKQFRKVKKVAAVDGFGDGKVVKKSINNAPVST